MICPICKHTDQRDMGVIRGIHVFFCRKCHAWLQIAAPKLAEITNPKVLGSLV
jgi:hypothetical protein